MLSSNSGKIFKRLHMIQKQLSSMSTGGGASESAAAQVLFQKEAFFAKITLNNPKALNALNLPMIRVMQSTLNQWKGDNKLKFILMNANGGKAFCAGGDIKTLYDAKKTNDSQVHDNFFREEYILDYTLALQTPPQVNFLDGIVMGGGVGLSASGRFNIATENTMFAMPEAKIGLFTDVGGSFFLPRMKKNIGYYIALTGARLKGKELYQIGFTNYYVKREDLPKLEADLVAAASENMNDSEIKKIIEKYQEPNLSRAFKNEDQINEIFNVRSFPELYEKLQGDKSELGQSIFKSIQEQCPISLRIIFEQLSRGKKLSLKESFEMEFRITQRFMRGKDFFEGVHSVLVDKTYKPQWSHKSPLDVTDKEIEAFFAPLESGKELVL